MKRLAPLALLSLAACAVGPNYQPPGAPSQAAARLPSTTANAGASAAPLPGKWWRLFDDPAIDPLVEKALAHNTDVRVAVANVRRARALLSEARSGRLPTSDVTGSATYNRIVTQQGGFGQNPGGGGGAGTPIGPFETDFYNLGVSAQYEVDLFGRVSRSIEAAKADLGAAQADADAARVTVAAETARAYAQACAYQVQAEVAGETAQLQGRTLELTRRLFEGGRGTQREVDQANLLVEQARAQVPVFQAERRAALAALATLTGDPPALQDQAATRCRRVPGAREAIPAGDGAAMLARRPDVRAAERRLAAETARIGVATAALYPSITIAGSATLSAVNPGDLFKSQSFGFSIGPALSFNFPFSGAARARVRQAEASTEAALATFDGALLTALRETEQALARTDGAVRSERSLASALGSAESAARLSRLRYDYGSDSFLQLLDAERSRAQARAAYAQAQLTRVDAQVTLFKALGGGWENAPEVSRTPVTP
jgi:NodT family efflux transporter outer membrane factor (OMF) lipoprotein